VELLVAVVSAIVIGDEVMGVKEWVGATMIVIATLLEATNGEVHG
jgi:drug/metabolite transporter (DMT)-like permease